MSASGSKKGPQEAALHYVSVSSGHNANFYYNFWDYDSRFRGIQLHSRTKDEYANNEVQCVRSTGRSD